MVITGAGAGMAKACAELFVQHGARVVAADISGKEKDTAAELGEAVVPVHCDVSQEDQVVAMFETAVREFGRVDAVLNVASIADGAPLADSTSKGSGPGQEGHDGSVRWDECAGLAAPRGGHSRDVGAGTERPVSPSSVGKTSRKW